MGVQERTDLVIVGHVDHGKSTLIGRILLDTHSLPKGRLEEVRAISQSLGKETELAYLADQLKEERENNLTIDVIHLFFKTKKRRYRIIDTPGHAEFLRNMISGATQAHTAVLLVDATEGRQIQTGRHLYILDLIGVTHLLVVVNKMDAVNHAEETFRKVASQIRELTAGLSLRPAAVIPVSARRGDNVVRLSSRMKWYRGPALIECLDTIRPPESLRNSPFRFAAQDVYRIAGKPVVVGKVVSGTVRKGQAVAVLPTGRETRIESIRVFGKKPVSASAGKSIGLTFKDELPLARGGIVSETARPALVADRFAAGVFWLGEAAFRVNEPLILRCATQDVPCRMEKIEARIDAGNIRVIEENAKELRPHEAGRVVIRTDQPLVCDEFSSVAETGRFVLERSGETLAAGIITGVIARSDFRDEAI